LRSLLTTSRPLRPTDLVPASGATTADRAADAAVSLPRGTPGRVRASLDTLRKNVADYLAALSPLYPADAAPHRADVLARIDTLLTGYAGLITTRAPSVWSAAAGASWRCGGAALSPGAGRRRRGRGPDDQTLAKADALLTTYDALPSTTSDTEAVSGCCNRRNG